MATKNGRSQIWYADGNGNVEGYTETVDNIAETIISTYNEHFGTDIQIWTPETKTLQVGDTVPNWNAYEKIVMQIVNWKYPLQQAKVTWLIGETYKIGNNGGIGIIYYVRESVNAYVTNAEGIVQGGGAPITEGLNTQVKDALNAIGINATTTNQFLVKEFETMAKVPNWDNMTELPSQGT